MLVVILAPIVNIDILCSHDIGTHFQTDTNTNITANISSNRIMGHGYSYSLFAGDSYER